MGPPNCWTSLAGERFIGSLKSFLPKGGAALDKIVFQRYLNYELAEINTQYDFSPPTTSTVTDYWISQPKGCMYLKTKKIHHTIR